MSTQVNAMFYVASVTKNAGGTLDVRLHPVTRNAKTDPGTYEPEGNTDWSKYTPGGQIQLTVYSDLPAAAWFEEHIGKDVPITFG